jgi:hypothetical protein
MDEIAVRPGGDHYVVQIGDASTHRVTVPDGYPAKLGLRDVDEQRLIEESFRFLLEREPKESILSSFELPVIARYFPEYPDEIAQRLG